MIHGGLKFEKSGDGAAVTVYDGVAENAPAVRTVFFSAQQWLDAVGAVGSVDESVAEPAEAVEEEPPAEGDGEPAAVEGDGVGDGESTAAETVDALTKAMSDEDEGAADDK